MPVFTDVPPKDAYFLHVREGADERLPGLPPAFYPMPSDDAALAALGLLYALRPSYAAGDTYECGDVAVVDVANVWGRTIIGKVQGDAHDLYAYIARQTARALLKVSPDGALGRVTAGAIAAASPLRDAPLLPPPEVPLRASQADA